MAFLFVESSPQYKSSLLQSAIKSLKLLFLSAGLVWLISTLLMLKGALMPYSCEIVFSNLVGFWNSIRCLLSSPLYICIIINSMVLLIAATSTFHRHETDNHDPPPFLPRDITEVEPPPETSLLSRIEICSSSTLYQSSDHDEFSHIFHYSTAQTCDAKASLSLPAEALMSDAHEIKKTTHLSEYTEGEMVTTNHPSHRKEGELFLEVEAEVTNNQSDEKENEEDDTLEGTWKAITGAKTKQLKKSETWKPKSSAAVETLRSEELPPSIASTSWKDLRKSETFNEAVSIRRIGGLRRDPSTGIDEFNQKVEAFIKKFNEDMRLQRQESDQRFIDMINRGL